MSQASQNLVINLNILNSSSTTNPSMLTKNISTNSIKLVEQNEIYTYDCVFQTELSDNQAFQAIGKPTLEYFLQGKSVSIISHPSWGSDRSFSLCRINSENEDETLLLKCCNYLLQHKQSVNISIIGIRNEIVHDLLTGTEVDEVQGIPTISLNTISDITNAIQKYSAHSDQMHLVVTLHSERNQAHFVDILAWPASIDKLQIINSDSIDMSYSALRVMINSNLRSPSLVKILSSKLTDLIGDSFKNQGMIQFILNASLETPVLYEETLSNLRLFSKNCSSKGLEIYIEESKLIIQQLTIKNEIHDQVVSQLQEQIAALQADNTRLCGNVQSISVESEDSTITDIQNKYVNQIKTLQTENRSLKTALKNERTRQQNAQHRFLQERDSFKQLWQESKAMMEKYEQESIISKDLVSKLRSQNKQLQAKIEEIEDFPELFAILQQQFETYKQTMKQSRPQLDTNSLTKEFEALKSANSQEHLEKESLIVKLNNLKKKLQSTPSHEHIEKVVQDYEEGLRRFRQIINQFKSQTSIEGKLLETFDEFQEFLLKATKIYNSNKHTIQQLRHSINQIELENEDLRSKPGETLSDSSHHSISKTAKEAEELKKLNFRLKTELKKRTDQNLQLKKKIEDDVVQSKKNTQLAVNKLSKQLQDAKRASMRLRADLKKVTEQNGEFKKRAKTEIEKCSNALQTTNELLKENEDLKSANTRLNQQAKEANQENKGLKGRMEEEYIKVGNSINRLETDLENQKKSNEQLRQNIELAGEENRELQKQIDHHKSTVYKFQSKIQSLELETSSLKDANSRLNSEIGQKDEETRLFKAKTDEEVQLFENNIKKLEKELENQRITNKKLKNDIQTVSDQNIQLKKTYEEEADETSLSLSKAQREIQDLKSNIKRKKTETKIQANEKTDLIKKIEEETVEREGLREAFNKLRQEADDFGKLNTKLREKVKILQDEISGLKRVNEEESTDAERLITQNQQEMEEMRGVCSRLKSEAIVSASQYSSLKQRYQDLQSESDETKSRQQNQIELLNSTVSRLKAESKALFEELGQIKLMSEAKNSDFDEISIKLTQTVESNQKLIANLKSEVRSLTDDVKRVNSQLQEKQEQINMLSDNRTQHFEDSQKLVKKLKKEIKSQSQQLARLKTCTEMEKISAEQLTNKLAQDANENRKIIAKLRNDLKSTTEENLNLKNKFEEEITQLQLDMSKCILETEESKRENAKLESKNRILGQEKGSLIRRLEDHAAQFQDSKTNIIKESDESKRYITRLRSEIRELNDTKTYLLRKNEEQAQQYQQRQKRLLSELEENKESVKSLKIETINLSQELKSLKKKIQESTKEYEETIQKLRREANEQKILIARYKSQLNSLTEQNIRIKQKGENYLIQSQESSNKLLRQTEENQIQIIKLKKELEQLRGENSELISKLRETEENTEKSELYAEELKVSNDMILSLRYDQSQAKIQIIQLENSLKFAEETLEQQRVCNINNESIIKQLREQEIKLKYETEENEKQSQALINQLKHEAQQHKSANASVTNEFQTLFSDINEMKTRIEKDAVQISEFQQMIVDLMKEVEKYRIQNLQLESEKRAQFQKNEDLETALQKASRNTLRAEQSQRQGESLKQIIEEKFGLKESIEQLRATLNNVVENKKQMEYEMDRMRQEYEHVKKELATSELSQRLIKEESMGSLKALQAELDSKILENKSLQLKIAEKISDSAEQQQNLQRKVSESKQKLKQLRSEIKKLEVENHDTRIKSQETTLLAFQKHLGEIDEQRKSILEYTHEITNLRKEISDMQIELKNKDSLFQQRLRQEQHIFSNLKQSHGRESQEKAIIVRKLEQASQTIFNLQQEIQNREESYASQLQDNSKKLHEKMTDFQDLDREAKTLRESCDGLKNTNEYLTRQLHQKTQQCLRLQIKLQQLETNNSQEVISKLMQVVEDHKNLNNQLRNNLQQTTVENSKLNQKLEQETKKYRQSNRSLQQLKQDIDGCKSFSEICLDNSLHFDSRSLPNPEFVQTDQKLDQKEDEYLEQIRLLTEKCAKYKKHNADLEIQIKNIYEEYVKRRSNQTQQTIFRLNSEIEWYKEQIQRLNKLVKESETSLVTERDYYESRIKYLEQEISQSGGSDKNYQRISERVQQLAQQLNHKDEALQESQMENQKLKSQINEIQQMKEPTLSSLSEKIIQEEAKNRDLAEKNKLLKHQMVQLMNTTSQNFESPPKDFNRQRLNQSQDRIQFLERQNGNLLSVIGKLHRKLKFYKSATSKQ